jgi:hypothetical protein
VSGIVDIKVVDGKAPTTWPGKPKQALETRNVKSLSHIYNLDMELGREEFQGIKHESE